MIPPPLPNALWLLSCLDKPKTPNPIPFFPTERPLLGQGLSLPGASGKKPENSTFPLIFLAHGDGGEKHNKNKKKPRTVHKKRCHLSQSRFVYQADPSEGCQCGVSQYSRHKHVLLTCNSWKYSSSWQGEQVLRACAQGFGLR